MDVENLHNTEISSSNFRDVRRDLENFLYDQWTTKSEDSKLTIEAELREVLNNHAKAVMYSILRKLDKDIVVEAVDKVMLSLSSFRGESLFTTWAHGVMLGVMYDERRAERRRKEVSLDLLILDFQGDSGPGVIDLMLTVKKLLTPKEFNIFEELVVLGNTQQEVSDKYGIPRTTLIRRWENITRILRHAFTKQLSSRS